MTFGQLRTFVAVAEAGSVRAAAERLVVTQPAVSAALAALQSELATPLVERSGRGLVLTPAGRSFAAYARRVLALVDEAVAVVGSQARPEQGRVRLAAVTTAGERIVPRLLATFRERYPEVGVALEVGNRLRVWDRLANHEVDLAIGGRPPAGTPLVSLATRTNTLVVVAAAGTAAVRPSRRRGAAGEAGGGPNGGDGATGTRPGAAGGANGVRRVTLADLAAATWLVREPGSGTRSTAEELFQSLDLAPQLLTMGSNGAITESVQIGLGVTLISRDAVAAELEAGRLEEWRYGPLPLRREWHLVGRSAGPLAPTAALFVDHILGEGDGDGRFRPVPRRT